MGMHTDFCPSTVISSCPPISHLSQIQSVRVFVTPIRKLANALEHGNQQRAIICPQQGPSVGLTKPALSTSSSHPSFHIVVTRGQHNRHKTLNMPTRLVIKSTATVTPA